MRCFFPTSESEAGTLLHGEALLVVATTNAKDVTSGLAKLLSQRLLALAQGPMYDKLSWPPLNSSPKESPETSLAMRLSKSGYLKKHTAEALRCNLQESDAP